jgi:hypothetical protein
VDKFEGERQHDGEESWRSAGAGATFAACLAQRAYRPERCGSVRRLTGVWVALAICLTVAVALSAAGASAATCSNEHVREESNRNVEDHPYSTLLPDCRAYEMVSPLEKQGRGAGIGETGNVILPIAASPDGGVSGWASEGSFAEPENFGILASPQNFYRSRRGAAGWTTSSAFGPRKLVNEPFQGPFDGDFSPDLTSYQATCGANTAGPGRGDIDTASLACASRVGAGEWKVSPSYTAVTGSEIQSGAAYLGGSSDLSRLFLQPTGQGRLQGEIGNGLPLALSGAASQGIYELAGIGSSSPTLRLVNVANPPPGAPPGQPGEELGVTVEGVMGEGPMLGDQRVSPIEWGGASHAISEDGRTVFITATPPPPAVPPESEVLTIYARRQCAPGSSSNCKEDGNDEFFETVTVSDPGSEECAECKVSERKPAYFMGASADGSKVFFMTEQKLLSTAPKLSLYEYDFNGGAGHRLVLLSEVEKEAGKVQGVMAISADGSHVYFVDVLGEKTNLYGYDTVKEKEKLKLIATAPGNSPIPWGFEPTNTNSSKPSVVGPFQNAGGKRPAQVTPDGRDLVFSSSAPLAGHEPEQPGAKLLSAPAVYRYDFPTGELTWVSHGAEGFKPPAGEHPALIASRPPRQFNQVGPNADIEDWGRAISGCPQPASAEAGEGCPEGSYDGEYIIFTTATRLQANALNGVSDLYEWHCPGNVDCAENGTVSLISDGLDPTGVKNKEDSTTTAMSATGSDIFFSTLTRLVGQDTDSLRDVYDARVGGGFPAPSEPPACSPEACQGKPENPPSFKLSASASTPPGGNLTPPASGPATKEQTPKAKTLSPAQQLAAALKACKTKRPGKRRSCESQARKRYAAQLRAQALRACKLKPKSERVRCEANARKGHRP